MTSPAAKRATRFSFFFFATLMLCATSVLAQQFVAINAPGANATLPVAINDLGQIVGYLYDSGGNQHGFLLVAGVYQNIDFPQALTTACTGINNNGYIVGTYNDVNNAPHGFSLINGIFTTIDDPAFPNGTYPSQISDPGLIAGIGFDAQNVAHGFSFANNTFTTIDYPGSVFTQILDMSLNGLEFVGVYGPPSYPAQPFQGFTDINGVFTSISYPGSASTQLNGVTNAGMVAGTYNLPDQTTSHVFLFNGTTYTTEDFPGAVSDGASNMNDLGDVVGEYFDGNNVIHGYVMTNGPFAYVANINSNSVSMIDILLTLPVATIPVGAGPWGVALSPNGKQVYVSNNHENDVSVIDAASSAVIATIPVQLSPFGLAFTPDGSAVYVVNGTSNSVSVISTASQTVVATVPVQGSPVGVAMAQTSNGTFAYVTNSASNTVSVIAVGASPAVVQTINVGSAPRWIAVSPNNSLAYVENGGGNNVSVISTASNTVTATIPVGAAPFGAAFSPDSSRAYVANSASNSVSVINTASNSVLSTIPGFNNPVHVALTPDGTSAYVTDLNSNMVSVVSTASNTITATAAVGAAPIQVAMAAAPGTTQQITQPLSPTLPNVFGFGSNNFVVQYPAGSTFSGINMTVTAIDIAEAQFQQRVAGTQFASATCIIYGGTGGNCVDYEVTCSTSNGTAISCPSEAQPTIAVQTSFSTVQPIVNPGFLTTPIGQNAWQNIFTGLSDITVKGKTQGFSEFVAVDLGVSNPQGLAGFQVVRPLFPATYTHSQAFPVTIRLTSAANGTAITNAHASISVEMIADARGNPTQRDVFAKANAFKLIDAQGDYQTNLNAAQYPAGTYVVVIYGDVFPAYQGQFKILH